MSKIIFIGGIWAKQEEDWIISNSKGAIQSAANIFQSNIIEGFDSNLSKPITIVSSIFVGSFPKRFRKIVIKSNLFNHSSHYGHQDYQVGFLNLPIIKNISKVNNIKKTLNTIINDKDDYYIVGYSMTYSIVKSLLYAKQINNKVFTCLFVPDLPEYMNLSKSNIFIETIKKRNRKLMYKDIKNIDSFVVLTKHMYGRLGVKKPYIVVEGVSHNDFQKEKTIERGSEEIILYSGSLNIQYGIKEMVDAMSFIPNKNIRLYICGGGAEEKYIKEKMINDPRIVYLGLLSNEECKIIQSKASLLINPRNSKEEYTSFSFPSKILEYMSSGTPVLMTKLPGIPDDYYDYAYIIDDESPEGIANAIVKTLSLPAKERDLKAKSAKSFVLKEKSSFAQTKRIIDFLDKSSC